MMSQAADQYAALVKKLEAISEADAPAESPSAGGAGIDKYKPNDGIPEIKAGSLSQAQAIALKQLGPGKKFRWCNTYKVASSSNKQQPAPMPSSGQSPWAQAGGAEVKK